MTNLSEKVMRIIFMLSATVSILAVIVICYFLAGQGLPAMVEIGVSDFLTGTLWKPLEGHFGIFPMIVGSIYVTAGAIILGVPVGLLCAIFMAKFCPRRLYSVLKPAVDLLAGIPSIVYGFFALMVIVPVVQELTGTSGKGILTASIMLAIMILPTIVSVSEASIRAVPESYYEGSLALGATHERSVFFATVPAAKSGIMAGGRGSDGARPALWPDAPLRQRRGGGAGHRTRHRRNHGCHHGGGKPACSAGFHSFRSTNNDSQCNY